MGKMKSDRLLYKATALDKSANLSAEQPINGGSHSSSDKGTTNTQTGNEKEQNNATNAEKQTTEQQDSKPKEEPAAAKRKRASGFVGEKKPTEQEKFDAEKAKFANAPKNNEYASVLKESNSAKEAVEKFRALIAEKQRKIEDWKNREYKGNKTVVTGTDRNSGADEYVTTIEAANERRRQASIEVLERQIEEISRWIDTLKDRTGYVEKPTNGEAEEQPLSS